MKSEELKKSVFLSEVPDKRNLKILTLHLLTHSFTKLFPKLSYKILLKFLTNPNSRREYELRTKIEPEEFRVETKIGYVNLFKFGNGKRNIFLIHGWADSTRRFTSLIDFLIENDDVCIWSIDHIGHGRSYGNNAHIFGFIDGLNECLNFINQKKHKIDVFISHSMGGLALLSLDKTKLHGSKKIIISSPSKFFEFMFKRVTAMGISVSSVENFLERLSKIYRTNWKAQSFSENLHKVDSSFIFIHDQDDLVCSLKNLKNFLKDIDVRIIETKDLGHLKILKKESVFKTILKFIKE